MTPNLRNWLMRPEEALPMLGLKTARLRSYYKNLLNVKTPGGIRCLVRPYATALVEFLAGRPATPELVAEFAKSPEGIEIANRERQNYQAWLEGRSRVNGGYLIKPDIALLFNVKNTVIGRWKLKARQRQGHGVINFYDLEAFKESCPIEGPGGQ